MESGLWELRSCLASCSGVLGGRATVGPSPWNQSHEDAVDAGGFWQRGAAPEAPP